MKHFSFVAFVLSAVVTCSQVYYVADPSPVPLVDFVFTDSSTLFFVGEYPDATQGDSLIGLSSSTWSYGLGGNYTPPLLYWAQANLAASLSARDTVTVLTIGASGLKAITERAVERTADWPRVRWLNGCQGGADLTYLNSDLYFSHLHSVVGSDSPSVLIVQTQLWPALGMSSAAFLDSSILLYRSLFFRLKAEFPAIEVIMLTGRPTTGLNYGVAFKNREPGPLLDSWALQALTSDPVFVRRLMKRGGPLLLWAAPVWAAPLDVNGYGYTNDPSYYDDLFDIHQNVAGQDAFLNYFFTINPYLL